MTNSNEIAFIKRIMNFDGIRMLYSFLLDYRAQTKVINKMAFGGHLGIPYYVRLSVRFHFIFNLSFRFMPLPAGNKHKHRIRDIDPTNTIETVLNV